MKKKKLYALSIAVAVFLSVFFGCSSETVSQKSEVLRVGVRNDIMNFGYYNETADKYYGLEIDLANIIKEKLGYKEMEFIPVQPENRKDTLLQGKVDCLIAAYTIADTRLENFDFSPPYYTDSLKIMIEKTTNIIEISQLQSARIGVLSGSSAGPQFLEKMRELDLIPAEGEALIGKNEGFEVVELDSYTALDEALEDGTVDAACLDGSIAQGYMNDDRAFIEAAFPAQSYGIATQKESELSAEIAVVLQELIDDGTVDQLINKWN